ncbi:hypothetical protein PPYR_15059, partial [Photinus pyralis]
FLNKLKSTVICNDNVKEIHSNLINCRDNIALLISKDLEFTEPLQKDITNKFPSHKNQIEKNLEDSRD